MIGDGQILWVEKYRPKEVKDCILPENIKATFQQYVDAKKIPNLILCGTAGVGKTTIARALCESIGADYIMVNGSNENGVDTLRIKIVGYASSVSLTGGRKVIIVDEADYLTAQAQAAFRGVIEEFSGNCSFIFTCNFVNRLMDAIHSRCAVIDFKLPSSQKSAMASGFMKRVQYILNEEQITFDPKVVAELIMKFFPDYRRVLNEMQRYSTSGKIDAGILTQLSIAKLDEMVGYMKSKDFKSLRKWVGSNSDGDSAVIMRTLYDRMYDIFTPQSVPLLVVLTGKYLYQASHVADQEINLMAYLTEVMVECTVK